MNPAIDRKQLVDLLKKLGNAYPQGLNAADAQMDEAVFTAQATYLLEKGLVMVSGDLARNGLVPPSWTIRITAAGIDSIAPRQAWPMGRANSA